MTTVREPDASVLDKDERAALFGAFLNIDDQRLNIERFRIKHKKLIPVIDRLIERKFIAAEGAFYRVTLDGLYALNNDATRAVIETFNTILPVLVSMYESEGRGKNWALRELVEWAARQPNLVVNEPLLSRALWHVLPHLRIAGGWTRTEPAGVASFTLDEAVLNFPALPLEKDLTVVEIRDDTFGDFLRAVQFEDSRLGIGHWIELASVAATANIRPDVARGCLVRLSRDGLCRQRDGERFLIDRDTITRALTNLAWGPSENAEEETETFSPVRSGVSGMRTTQDPVLVLPSTSTALSAGASRRPRMEKRYEVFISSTFVDLKEERESVMRAVLKLNCFPAGMELFPAADTSQFEVIKRAIDRSDYYVVLVAGRYGSLGEKNLSYTEMEFDYAVSQRIPVLAFVHGNPDSIPVGKTDKSDEARRLLEAFREKVSRGRMRNEWLNPDDLAVKVTLALVNAFDTDPRQAGSGGRFKTANTLE